MATTTTTSTPPSQPSSSTQPPPQQADHRARNREAANRCRAKGKVAVAELEATERAMSTEHEALARTARSLRDEVLALKNQLLMHGNCDDDVIQQYLANSARMVGSGAAAMLGPAVTTAGPVIRRPVLAGPPGVGGGSSSRAVLSASPPGVPPHSPVSGAGTTAGSGRQRDGRPKH
ncbi:putative transcription factor atf21 [Diaporthe ampelina]|uniref:Putative transcription factor atf21 n=1 Tax=Diaporthe ampelina TaxID=1214573 RepID=A0A0G2FRF8_9PEZI|nr:putative transcription factor atf21 [Diaporthe ampelina]